MSRLSSIDLIVADVLAAADFFGTVVGMEIVERSERFASLRSGDFTLMLSPDALVPIQKAAGVILHLQVEDISAVLDRAEANGGKLLYGPSPTDWGTESALLQGPEGVIVDIYCNL